MKIDENSMIPIYVQIADSIEDDILSGKLKENDTCYSQLVLAKELKVNPATAAKGNDSCRRCHKYDFRKEEA